MCIIVGSMEQPIKLSWSDKILAKTFLRLIPQFVTPNQITWSRFLLTPFVLALLWTGQYVWGMIAFLVVSFTDALDGSLARTRNKVTDWGKLYDPLADKLLIGMVVYVLVAKYVDFYAAWIIIFIEILIIIAAILKRKNGGCLEANIWGKIKMVLQVTGVMIMLLGIIFDFTSFLHLSRGTFYLSIAFGIISLFTYSI